MSKKTLLMTTGIVGASILVYSIDRYRKGFNRTTQFEKDLKKIGEIYINDDNVIELDTFLKITKIIYEYSKELKKINRKINRTARQYTLESRNFSLYTSHIIKAYEIEYQTEEYIKSLALDIIEVPEKIYNDTFNAYKNTQEYKEFAKMLYELDDNVIIEEEEVQIIFNDKKKFDKEIDIQLFVPEEYEKDCEDIIKDDWREVIKNLIIDDKLYAKYKITLKDLEIA